MSWLRVPGFWLALFASEAFAAMPQGTKWDSEEITLALGLYLITPYTRIDKKDPRAVMLGSLLGRTGGSVAMKLANLAALDPEVAKRGRKGFGNGSQVDRRVWDDFFDPATGLIATARLRDQIEEIAQARRLSLDFLDAEVGSTSAAGAHQAVAAGTLLKTPPERVLMRIDGVDRLVTRKERVHQNFFRRAVLANCDMQCAVTHLSEPSLLEAAHILPWSEYPDTRLEVGNGLALNSLLHAAYDQNLLGITGDGVVEVTEELLDGAGDFRKFFSRISRHQIDTSKMKQPPRADFLDARYQQFCAAQH